MIKDLVKIANRLDSLGLTKEADIIDRYVSGHIKVAASSTTAGKLFKTTKNCILVGPEDDSTKNYLKFQRSTQNAYDIASEANVPVYPFYSYKQYYTTIVSGEDAVRALGINGYYMLVTGDNSDVLKNKYYFVTDGKISEIKLNKGVDPTIVKYSSEQFIKNNHQYKKLTDQEYRAAYDSSMAMEQEKPVGPVADDQSGEITIEESPTSAQGLWNDAEVKAKWIQRSTKLKRYTTQENFNLWLKRKGLEAKGKADIMAALQADMDGAK